MQRTMPALQRFLLMPSILNCSAASSVCVGLEGTTTKVASLMINYSTCQTRNTTNFFPVTFHTGALALVPIYALPAVFPARCWYMRFEPLMPISFK